MVTCDELCNVHTNQHLCVHSCQVWQGGDMAETAHHLDNILGTLRGNHLVSMFILHVHVYMCWYEAE